ncbi:hypothetical protein LZ32DRAFT_434455 [Colletotrichum eremochloae]|nr:hypothetical protein LZ32DRAFT_434455 [Colletotrichum eremochloae]
MPMPAPINGEPLPKGYRGFRAPTSQQREPPRRWYAKSRTSRIPPAAIRFAVDAFSPSSRWYPASPPGTEASHPGRKPPRGRNRANAPPCPARRRPREHGRQGESSSRASTLGSRGGGPSERPKLRARY